VLLHHAVEVVAIDAREARGPVFGRVQEAMAIASRQI
jgi:hypothetical protein